MKSYKYIPTICALSLILATIFIGWYFLIILPEQNQQELIINQQRLFSELKAKCTTLGQSKYLVEKKGESSDEHFLLPKYSYNKSLDSCLYRGIYISNNFRSKYIINLDTNDTIVTSDYVNDELFYGLTDEEFSVKEGELFR